jgi:sec-independent protein translocase protein TatA
MFGLGAGEVFVLLILALIFLGPSKLPELAKGLGKALRDLQNLRTGIVDAMNPQNEKPVRKVVPKEIAVVTETKEVLATKEELVSSEPKHE